MMARNRLWLSLAALMMAHAAAFVVMKQGPTTRACSVPSTTPRRRRLPSLSPISSIPTMLLFSTLDDKNSEWMPSEVSNDLLRERMRKEEEMVDGVADQKTGMILAVVFGAALCLTVAAGLAPEPVVTTTTPVVEQVHLNQPTVEEQSDYLIDQSYGFFF